MQEDWQKAPQLFNRPRLRENYCRTTTDRPKKTENNCRGNTSTQIELDTNKADKSSIELFFG